MFKQPVIITCAITGNRTTRAIAPVPLTPEEQFQSSKGAVRDGAAIIHLHVRTDNGEESLEPERYHEAISKLHQITPKPIIEITPRGTDPIVSSTKFELGAISGTLQNWRMKTLKIETVSLLTFPAMLTTEIGVAIATAIPSKWLLLSFAALQISAIWLMNLKNNLQKQEYKTGSIDNYRSPVDTSIPIIKTQAIGLVAGILSGLFGVGGGIVMVPLQVLILKMSIKESVQTSYGAIVLISLWAVTRYAIADSTNVLLLPGTILGMGSIVGANYGARLLPKLSEKLVKFLFTFLLILLASYMSFKALAL